MRADRGNARGISLLELIVALVIVGLLLSLAVPSYVRYAQRGDRVEAIQTLMSAAACQERVRAATGYYDTTACVKKSANSGYQLTIEPQETKRALGFTLRATPRQKIAGDPCGFLSLDQAGTRGIEGDPEVLADCWGGK